MQVEKQSVPDAQFPQRQEVEEKAEDEELDVGVSPPNDEEPYIPTPKTKKIVDLFPHRHYVNLHPVNNKLLAMKEDNILRQRHLNRIQSIKPFIDIEEPRRYRHLQVNLKKIQINQDRNNDISRCNKVMLERMTHIMRETGNTYGNDHEIVAKHLRNVAFRREMKRQRQHEKIQSENQIMLNRLEEKKPAFSREKWSDTRNIELSYLQNISAFPQKFILQKRKLENQIRNRKNKTFVEPEEEPVIIKQEVKQPKYVAPLPQQKKKLIPKIKDEGETKKIAREGSAIEAQKETKKPLEKKVSEVKANQVSVAPKEEEKTAEVKDESAAEVPIKEDTKVEEVTVEPIPELTKANSIRSVKAASIKAPSIASLKKEDKEDSIVQAATSIKTPSLKSLKREESITKSASVEVLKKSSSQLEQQASKIQVEDKAAEEIKKSTDFVVLPEQEAKIEADEHIHSKKNSETRQSIKKSYSSLKKSQSILQKSNSRANSIKDSNNDFKIANILDMPVINASHTSLSNNEEEQASLSNSEEEKAADILFINSGAEDEEEDESKDGEQEKDDDDSLMGLNTFIKSEPGN